MRINCFHISLDWSLKGLCLIKAHKMYLCQSNHLKTQFICSECSQRSIWHRPDPLGVFCYLGRLVSALVTSAVNTPGVKLPGVFTLEEAVELCERSLIWVGESVMLTFVWWQQHWGEQPSFLHLVSSLRIVVLATFSCVYSSPHCAIATRLLSISTGWSLGKNLQTTPLFHLWSRNIHRAHRPVLLFTAFCGSSGWNHIRSFTCWTLTRS